MTVWLLIPVQPPDAGKTRLSPLLSVEERAALGRRFFAHVLGVATQVVPPARCMVVSRADEILKAAADAGALAVREQGEGLNAALEQGAAHAVSEGADAILSLSTDLPHLTEADIRAMLDAMRRARIVIAPDTARTGTNALLLTPPGLIPYRYGAASFQAHLALAKAAGERVEVVTRPGLACDIDTPLDLRRLSNPTG